MRSALFSGASRLLRYNRNSTLLTRCKSSRATASSLDSQQHDAVASEDGKPESVEESPEQQQQLPTREPLAKNFFIGVVDKELLAYPEVIPRDDMSQLENSVLPLKNYFGESPGEPEGQKSTAETFRQLGLYGLNVPKDFEGQGYGWSASLIASEPDSSDTSLTLSLQSHRVVVDLLKEVGSLLQKQRYLPELCAGRLIATEAIYEYTLPEEDYFNTKAEFQSETGKWSLSGEKSFVVCTPGERQLFLVLAQTQQPNVPGVLGRGSTIFLVDSQQEGVRLGEKHATFGCQEADIRRVNFEQVKLSEDQVLGLPHDGNRYSEQLVRSSRLRGSLVGVSLAKKLLNQLTQYSVDTTQCGVQLK